MIGVKMTSEKILITAEFKDISDWLSWSLKHSVLSPGSQRVLDTYYSSYKKNFPPYVRAHYHNQTIEMMRCIGPGTKVLELGCGCGTESLWFALNGAAVVGADLKADRLAVARERRDYIHKNVKSIDAEFIDENIFNLPASYSGFDVIWMEQAFHHIEPREQLAAKLSKLLKPGGRVVISEANAYNLALQLLLYRKRGTNTLIEYTDKEGVLHAYGNERITTASRIAKLFAAEGFETISCRHFRVLPNFRGVEYFIWVEKLIPGWLLPAYTHFNIVLQKTF